MNIDYRSEREIYLSILKEIIDENGDAGRIGRARAAIAMSEKIDEWIESNERRFQRLETEGHPPNCCCMTHFDYRNWKTYSKEKKRECARMNLYPPAGIRGGSRY